LPRFGNAFGRITDPPALALDQLDPDHAAHRPHRRERRGKQRVGRLTPDAGNPDHDAKRHEPNPVRPPKHHRLRFKSRQQPERDQSAEDPQLNPRKTFDPNKQGSGDRLSERAFHKAEDTPGAPPKLSVETSRLGGGSFSSLSRRFGTGGW